jgi:hypothetical protein
MSDLQFKRLVVVIGGLFAALYLGYKVGTDSWALGAAACLAAVYYLTMRTFRVTHETLILSFLVFGYIVGNRGFAQITPLGNLPIFLGELGLFIGSFSILLHIPFRREFPFRLNALSIAILIWVTYGAIHTYFDLKTFGLIAMRDFAMVYYALYFFLAHPMARDPRSRRFFVGSLSAALILLIPFFVLFTNFPAFFYYSLVVDGAPLIAYKGDLVGAYCAMGFFFFFLVPPKNLRLPGLILGLVCLAITLYTTSRAAWVGLALGFGVLLFVRKHHVFRTLGAAALIAVIPMSIYFGFFVEDIEQTHLYGFYEHLLSIADISGTGNYQNVASASSGANNRYRLEWWTVVLQDTWRSAPLTGLGFGYNLTDHFILKYFNLISDDFSVRSPHSILMSVFGRTGILGIILFSFVILGMVKSTWLSVEISRTTHGTSKSLPYWCMVWAIFGSACFGVVLEGPMGAIVFWTLLGVANARTLDESTEFETSTSPHQIKVQRPEQNRTIPLLPKIGNIR